MKKFLQQFDLVKIFTRSSIAYIITYAIMSAVAVIVAPKFLGAKIIGSHLINVVYKISAAIAFITGLLFGRERSS